MKFNTIMDEKIVSLDMEAQTKDEALKKMAQMLYNDGRIFTLDRFIQDVYERESMETTNMDIGVAIPHSKSETIKKTSVALVRLNKEISWEDFGEPVKIIFLLAVSPNDDGVEHLELIAKIAELLIDERFVDRLYKTRNVRRLLKRINRMIGG